jgi:Mg2+ and Co2+ transporter CorA
MSKKLQKKATKLVRKAAYRAMVIRGVVREYNDAVQTSSDTDAAERRDYQGEIERAVAKYNRVHKEIRRVRRKLESKGGPSARVVGLRDTQG